MTSSGANQLSRLSATVTDDDQLLSCIVTARDELDRLAAEWNDLLHESEADTVFLTWEWISTWLDAVYPDARLCVVVLRDCDGRLIAVATFYCSDLRVLRVLKYKCLRVLGDCQSGAEYGDVIIRRGYEATAMTCIIRELLKHRDLWDCIYISNMAGWTGARERFGEACAQLGLPMRERVREFSAVRLPETYDAYLKLLSRNAREQIRRKTKRLQKSHEVEFICDLERDEIGGRLESLFSLHRRRWESVGQAGSFVRRPPMRRFYEAFAPLALSRRWLRLYWLDVDGITQAVQYGYVYGGTFLQLQEGYEPDGFEGIGNILRSQVFEECIREGLREYDFLGEFTEHKRRWGASPRNGHDLLIGRRCARNLPLFWRDAWPGGRFLREGRPASEGCSHD